MDILIDVGSMPTPGERREPGLKDKEGATTPRSMDKTGGDQDTTKNPGSESFDGHMAVATRDNRDRSSSKAAGEAVPARAETSLRHHSQASNSNTEHGASRNNFANHSETSHVVKSNAAAVSQNGILPQSSTAENGVALGASVTAAESEAFTSSDFSADELRKVLGDRLENRGVGSIRNAEAVPANLKTIATALTPAAGSAMITPDLLVEQNLTPVDVEPEVLLGKLAGSSAPGAMNAVGGAQAALSAAPVAAAQIVAAIKAERTGNSVEVRLDPPEMGRVRIDFIMETAEAVRAVLTAERPETLEHLRRNMDDLLAQLKQAGFSTVDLEFSGEGASAFSENLEVSTGDENAADDASQAEKDIVYLSIRDGAQLNLLV